MTTDDDKPLTPQSSAEAPAGSPKVLGRQSPGAIVFSLKRTKKAGETYPLKLTQQQRETLLQCTNLSRGLKKKIEQAGEGTQIVGVTWNELHKLNDEAGQAAIYAPNTDKKRLMAVMSRVVKFFEEEHAEVLNRFPEDRQATSQESDLLYQFKITLLDIHRRSGGGFRFRTAR